ncbi:Aminopeptidase N [Nymphon striatum]|nr:Aminopeptidase N [Nymphon striatum]
MTSISNMPMLRSEPRPEGYVADIYNTTVKMSTYLLAFVVSDFVQLKSPSQEIDFRVWARKDVIDQARYSLDIGPKMLKYYENYFNITYPLPKIDSLLVPISQVLTSYIFIDMFAAPEFAAGAMENWGLIIYRETAMLVDPQQSSSANRQRVATVVSHELAHQWFGNLVTPQWWDDLWLNEGFASYVEYLGLDAVHPEWKMHDQFVVDQIQNSMSLDGLKSSHPISVPVYRPEDVNEIFDRISYSKGCSIIRMMRFFLGAKTFQKGLTNYLNAKKFSNAVQNDLWKYLTKAAQDDGKDINVRKVMDSWTLQTGFPVVDMIRDYPKKTVKLTQTRFLFDPTNQSESQIWEIPMTFTSSGKKNWDPENIVFWFTKKHGELVASDGVPPADEWIVANIHETGFYKVNYDTTNWKMLINQLQTNIDEIPTTNRAQLIDDALDLAKAGLIDYDLALNITLYLDKETEFVPWDAAIVNLHYIDRMLGTTSAYGKWKQYLLKKVLPLYDRVGWEEKPEESILEQYKRVGALAWACKYDHKPCVDRAKAMFKQWMTDNKNPTSPNLRGVVYCSAMANGGDAEFDFAWKQYHLTQVASERDKLMSAMTCSQQPWIISTLMQRAMNSSSGIRKQDAAFVFRFMSGQVVGSLLSFNFVRNNWPLIYEVYGDSFFSLSGIIRSISSRLNTRFQLEELKKFYVEQKTLNRLGTAKRAFEQAIETAQVNVYWNEKNFKVIDSWLDRILAQKD